MRALTILVLSAGVMGACLLSACGKKGPPEPPGPPSAIIYPKTYPTH